MKINYGMHTNTDKNIHLWFSEGSPYYMYAASDVELAEKMVECQHVYMHPDAVTMALSIVEGFNNLTVQNSTKFTETVTGFVYYLGVTTLPLVVEQRLVVDYFGATEKVYVSEFVSKLGKDYLGLKVKPLWVLKLNVDIPALTHVNEYTKSVELVL